jgi:hypothetical protein
MVLSFRRPSDLNEALRFYSEFGRELKAREFISNGVSRLYSGVEELFVKEYSGLVLNVLLRKPYEELSLCCDPDGDSKTVIGVYGGGVSFFLPTRNVHPLLVGMIKGIGFDCLAQGSLYFMDTRESVKGYKPCLSDDVEPNLHIANREFTLRAVDSLDQVMSGFNVLREEIDKLKFC